MSSASCSPEYCDGLGVKNEKRSPILGMGLIVLLGFSRKVTDSTVNKILYRPLIERPLSLLGDTTYAATWVRVAGKRQLLIASHGPSGRILYGPDVLKGALPLSDLPADCDLTYVPPEELLWSAKGLTLWRLGLTADAGELFVSLCEVVRTFIDFEGSIASQEEMERLVSLFIMASYFGDAFTVAAYLWLSGLTGSGKTDLLMLISKVGYLAQMLLSQSSSATLRDMAHYGALLCFDDAEALTAQQGDPVKRELLLGGNREGARITVNKARGSRDWEPRSYSAYCPKAFTAISLPFDTLGSRSIFIPLVRSDNPELADADPADELLWPTLPRELIDYLWNLAITKQRRTRQLFQKARGEVSGREFQPWRPLVAIARLIDEDSPHLEVESLVRRLISLHGESKDDFVDEPSPARFAVQALRELVDIKWPRAMTSSDKYDDSRRYTFTVGELAAQVNAIAKAAGQDDRFTTEKGLGLLLNKLVIQKEPRTAGRRTRVITGRQLNRLSSAYGVRSDPSQSSQLVTSSAPPPPPASSQAPPPPPIDASSAPTPAPSAQIPAPGQTPLLSPPPTLTDSSQDEGPTPGPWREEVKDV